MEIRVNSLITNRKSTVSFSEKAIEPEKIRILFNAASLAPSSMNQQPWRFLYAIKDSNEQYKRFFDCLMEGNKLWAIKAPLLILSVAETISDYKNRPNQYASHDVGLATSNLMLQALELGLVSHPMGGFDKALARKNLKIPERFDPIAMLAVGYPGNIEDLPTELRERELKQRSRKPMEQIVFEGSFGTQAKT